MKIIHNDTHINENSVISIGKFDACHKGHQKIFNKVSSYKNLNKIIYILNDNSRHLYDRQEMLDLLCEYNFNYIIFEDMTEDFLKISAEEFLKRLALNYNIRKFVIGNDFRFGYMASGDTEYLIKKSYEYNYTVETIPFEIYRNAKISSSRIKKCIENGRITEANSMLGREYSVRGNIISGMQLGSKINFPTANINTDKILPEFGVYATKIRIQDRTYPSISNVGIKPTVSDNKKPNIETHIFDFNRNIYGQKAEIRFIKKIRDEIKFPDINMLSLQIENDVRKAKKYLQV